MYTLYRSFDLIRHIQDVCNVDTVIILYFAFRIRNMKAIFAISYLLRSIMKYIRTMIQCCQFLIAYFQNA